MAKFKNGFECKLKLLSATVVTCFCCPPVVKLKKAFEYKHAFTTIGTGSESGSELALLYILSYFFKAEGWWEKMFTSQATKPVSSKGNF